MLNNTQKIEIVRLALVAGKSLNKTHFANSYNISVRTLNRYINAFKEEAATQLNKPTKSVERSNGRINLIREVLQNSENKLTREIYNELVVKAQEKHMKELSKGAWYSIIGQVRKKLNK